MISLLEYRVPDRFSECEDDGPRVKIKSSIRSFLLCRTSKTQEAQALESEEAQITVVPKLDEHTL